MMPDVYKRQGQKVVQQHAAHLCREGLAVCQIAKALHLSLIHIYYAFSWITTRTVVRMASGSM